MTYKITGNKNMSIIKPDLTKSDKIYVGMYVLCCAIFFDPVDKGEQEKVWVKCHLFCFNFQDLKARNLYF